MNRAEDLYAAEKGNDKLAEQRKMAALYWPCCGEWKEGPHHEACKNFKPEEQPAVIDGQESLL